MKRSSAENGDLAGDYPEALAYNGIETIRNEKLLWSRIYYTQKK